LEAHLQRVRRLKHRRLATATTAARAPAVRFVRSTVSARLWLSWVQRYFQLFRNLKILMLSFLLVTSLLSERAGCGTQQTVMPQKLPTQNDFLEPDLFVTDVMIKPMDVPSEHAKERIP
jgi:hypothetical protein